jgi:hypothetical protein
MIYELRLHRERPQMSRKVKTPKIIKFTSYGANFGSPCRYIDILMGCDYDHFELLEKHFGFSFNYGFGKGYEPIMTGSCD